MVRYRKAPLVAQAALRMLRCVEVQRLHAGGASGSRLSELRSTYGVAINPLAVATIQRLPQRTIESIRPTPGTLSPCVAVQTPPGPSRTTVLPRTSRTVHPSIVVGLVSGAGTIVSRSATETPGRLAFACTTEEA